MNNLKKLQGAKILSKQEQQVVKGGKRYCSIDEPCSGGYVCIDHVCELQMIDF
jgi:hypothetical protein